ncbi:FKBP-type peptidyl-prolyl cis-trans isomerase [Desulfospira joergensenii]|uniref:FKBP-type peptidyl-prolyl cis-trans isomerase n=1 Tax=Desulfospira joergensenii TaxID=53329 RepID=UPI0003B6E8F5|nr:peptidylprolyl isomerase [Desulfospira joergensenii]
MTEAIKSGDTIAVDYTGKLENGDIFDSSEGREPLTFTVGAGMLIPGFDTAVVGMKKGESKTVTIPPEQGYGPKSEEAFVDIPRVHIPDEIPLEVGLELQLQDPNGRPVPARVMEISEESVKMDINHFLAGQTLEFDITIAQTGLEPPAQDCGCGCGTDAKDCGTGCEGGCDH